MLHYKIIVSGQVQGVCFRAFTQETANTHDIVGTVKNLADGSVEIIAYGNEDNMHLFLQECHKGPLFSSVKHIEVTELTDNPHSSEFIILDR